MTLEYDAEVGWFRHTCTTDPKICFCIGADKCNDTSCELVKKYRKNKDKYRIGCD